MEDISAFIKKIEFEMDETFKKNKFKNNNKVVISGFGIGLSWGATILKF